MYFKIQVYITTIKFKKDESDIWTMQGYKSWYSTHMEGYTKGIALIQTFNQKQGSLWQEP